MAVLAVKVTEVRVAVKGCVTAVRIAAISEASDRTLASKEPVALAASAVAPNRESSCTKRSLSVFAVGADEISPSLFSIVLVSMTGAGAGLNNGIKAY